MEQPSAMDETNALLAHLAVNKVGTSTMNKATNHDERIRTMTFSSVYPHYLAKIEKKGRTKAELHQVIAWLTGYNDKDILRHIQENSTFETFFA